MTCVARKWKIKVQKTNQCALILILIILNDHWFTKTTYMKQFLSCPGTIWWDVRFSKPKCGEKCNPTKLKKKNKNAFQSKAHLPLANRKSNTYNLTLVWPWPHLWPWPQTSQTKLNWCPGSKISIFHEMTLTLTQWPWYSTWTRYGQDVPPYQKWSFYVNWFKSYSPNRHTHIDTTKTLPLPHTREVKRKPNVN